jgi:hypothetical protein
VTRNKAVCEAVIALQHDGGLTRHAALKTVAEKCPSLGYEGVRTVYMRDGPDAERLARTLDAAMAALKKIRTGRFKHKHAAQ